MGTANKISKKVKNALIFITKQQKGPCFFILNHVEFLTSVTLFASTISPLCDLCCRATPARLVLTLVTFSPLYSACQNLLFSPVFLFHRLWYYSILGVVHYATLTIIGHIVLNNMDQLYKMTRR